MKTEHTQGNWKAVAQMPEGYSIENEQGQVIAFTQCDQEYNDINPITQEQEVSNAYLIASAPELLKASILCRDIADRCNNAMLSETVQQVLKSIETTLTEAIKKATEQ